MHIPDAYLGPATQAAAFAVMVPVWVVASRRTKREFSTRQTPLLSIAAAFCFAVQMFNIPALGGTTAHALGAMLLVVLVGRWPAIMGMTLTLTIQALLFGDGGILSLGANCFSMAFVACSVGDWVYRLVSGSSDSNSARRLVGATAGAYAGIVAASLSAGILLGIQPLIAHDTAGHALYCPFGLSVSIPAMMLTHMLVAGPAEAIITVAAVVYLRRAFPEIVSPRAAPKIGTPLRLAKNFLWVLLLTPLGLIATGEAWGEWDLEAIQKMVGYEPAGIAKAHPLVSSPLPDYGFAGLESKPWLIAGYLFSALVGCLVVAFFARTLLRGSAAVPKLEQLRSVPAGPSPLPAWMTVENPTLPEATYKPTPWMERTTLRMRSTIAKTIGSETVARSNGLLQSIHPKAKGIGFVCALIATSLSHSPYILVALLAATAIAAKMSAAPMRETALRIAGSVIFFGFAIAGPMSLAAVTPGPTVFSVSGIAFSTTGIEGGLTLLLRLATGISLAILWCLTTRWMDLLGSLRSIGVPASVLTTATLTYRYLFVIMETLAEMVQARTARQVGALDKSQARTYAGTGSAILFAKSLAFMEEMHLAMLARGFDGAEPAKHQRTWKWQDYAATACGSIFLVFVILQGVLHVA